MRKNAGTILDKNAGAILGAVGGVSLLITIGLLFVPSDSSNRQSVLSADEATCGTAAPHYENECEKIRTGPCFSPSNKEMATLRAKITAAGFSNATLPSEFVQVLDCHLENKVGFFGDDRWRVVTTSNGVVLFSSPTSPPYPPDQLRWPFALAEDPSSPLSKGQPVTEGLYRFVRLVTADESTGEKLQIPFFEHVSSLK